MPFSKTKAGPEPSSASTQDAKDGAGRRAAWSSLLTVGCAIILTTIVGGGAWLYLTADIGAGDASIGRPQVTMSLNTYRTAEPLDSEAAAVDGAPLDTASGSAELPARQSPESERLQQLAAAGLHPHPDPMLVEKSDLGPLPIIGKDGRRPWRVYARPFSRLDTRPRVAVIMSGLGISENATLQAIDMLPGSVTLSFAPFTKRLSGWIDKGRAKGHEVLLDLPMEPIDYPQNDPGPHTLLASVPIDQNLRQLEWILSRATGYVGVSTFMGSGLTTKPRALTPILTELKARGLMLVDTRENPLGLATKLARDVGLTVVANNVFVDQIPTAAKIQEGLAGLEKRAKRDGAAIAVARPYPVTLKQLSSWIGGLDAKGIAIAPVSALAPAEGQQ